MQVPNVLPQGLFAPLSQTHYFNRVTQAPVSVAFTDEGAGIHLNAIGILILLYMCPHTTICVSSSYDICVLILLCVSSFYYVCVYVSSYYYICVQVS
jgi:hypothetical protein